MVYAYVYMRIVDVYINCSDQRSSRVIMYRREPLSEILFLNCKYQESILVFNMI